MRGEKDKVRCNHRICSQETKWRDFLRLYKPCWNWSQKGMSSFIRSCTCCGQQIAPAPRVMTAIGFLHAVLYISLCCALVVLMRSGTVLKSILSGAVALAATIFVVYYPTRTAIADVLLLLFKWRPLEKQPSGEEVTKTMYRWYMRGCRIGVVFILISVLVLKILCK